MKINTQREPQKCVAQAFSPRVLNHAWRKLSNDRSAWRRNLPMDAMKNDVIRHIGELREDVLSGRYRPETMRCFTIRKADGGTRLIGAPFVRDKLAQRALLTVLETQAESLFHPDSFGYRPQCTREMACARVREWVRQGWTWLGDADIVACFDRIPRHYALLQLHQLCGDADAVALTGQWLDSLPRQYQLAPGLGLPQGMVLSPLLCNLYLHQMDRELSRQGIPFVRYADDFIVFGRSADQAAAHLDYAGRLLRCLDLALHPGKTQVIQTSPKHRFLGYRLPPYRKHPLQEQR